MNPPALVPASEHPREIPAFPDGVCLRQLENGLVIVVGEDHSAPVVSAQAWCKAGSVDEGRWLGAGLSHVLEHMLFKGTERRPPGRIDQEVQEAGGYMNAYTSFDRTVYWINVPNTGARVALDVLADITTRATLPEAELSREMDVIRREMDMGHDDPARHSGRRLFETAYTQSPYRCPVIGYPDIFNRLTRADIVDYYREKYAPNNLFFVVVGDVDADAVVAQLGEAFAGIPAQPLPAPVLPFEPRQMAAREVTEETSVELAHVHYAWHTTDLRHPDVPRLDVLSVLLGGGRSSRLYQELRQKQALVASIDAWTYNPGNAGLAGVSAILEADRLEAADRQIRMEIERLANDAVGPEELAKAVKQFVSATLATRKTMQGQAQDLGSNWMAASDLNFSARYLAAVQAITPEEIREVARKYFTAVNRTRYALVPKGAAPTVTVSRRTEVDHPVTRMTLGNGLTLLHKEDRRLPFVEFRLVLAGGLLAETPRNNGVTQLLARMLLQGSRTRSADQIATAIESVGGHLDSYSGNNSFGLSAEVLRDEFSLGLDLLADTLLHPAFPAPDLERERQLQLAAIRAQDDQMLPSAFRALRRRLFGPQGYGLDLLGSAESVGALRIEDLQAAHQRLVHPGRSVLAVYGDIARGEVLPAVEAAFGAWAARGETAAGAGADPGGKTGTGRTELARDKRQAVLAVGFPGASITSPDRHALELVQESCSDLGSRLFTRIREELGLAYYVGAQNFVGLVPGYFAFYAGTAPEHAARVEQELLAEARALCGDGLTADELRRAKAKIIGHKKIARQELGSYALATALDELYGLGYAHTEEEDALIEAVTLEQVRAAAAACLCPERAVVALVGPTGEARPGTQV
ncbi:MAG: insulinase family protein [Verrucomicrobiales bacterium]|nr:insulinase family protein [Verrucomicrobiales bacterium]